MSHPVLRELSNHRYLRERLEAEFPEAGEEALLDTLEGMTRLTDMLAVSHPVPWTQVCLMRRA